MNKPKIIVATLALSASAFVGLVANEGFTDTTIIPVKGDVPTIGFGTTEGVKMGDKTTPVKALLTAQAHISKEESVFRDSLPGVKLSQAEYDLYIDWLYQYGSGSWRNSSMRKNLLAGDYVAACNSLLKYKFVAKRDCSIRSNNCYGVWTRQQERYSKCMGAQ